LNHLKTRKFWIFAVIFTVSFTAISVLFYSNENSPKDPNAPKGYSGVVTNHTLKTLPVQNNRVPSGQQPSDLSKVKKINPFKDLSALEKKFKSKFQLDISPAGKPFRLSGKFNIEKLEGESDSETLSRLLNQVSSIMNIDSPEQLKNSQVQTASLGTITNFEQIYEDIPIDGAQVRVHQDSKGNVFMINSTYISNVTNVNTSYQVTAEEAQRIATQHAQSLDPQARTPTLSIPSKVIYQFRQSPNHIESCWKINVNQPWLGAAHGSASYFINAHRADVNDTSTFDRVENSIQ